MVNTMQTTALHTYTKTNHIHGLVAGRECPDCEVYMGAEDQEGNPMCPQCGHTEQFSTSEPFVSSQPCTACGDTVQQNHRIYWGFAQDPAPVRLSLCEDCADEAEQE